ncbi:arsenate reductase ArsC [Ammonicoccus fulvus]|uniref:Arsenate reductase ArsC n=1 Tax=Ammonicoccus fulvus TaxID=3138240 RepID=A0ABZ3FMP7_9ACTN
MNTSEVDFQAVVDDLAYRYSDSFSREVIVREVTAVRTQLEQSARKRQFLGMLVAKKARDRLAALAEAEGREFRPVPVILYACVHNAGRSQFAAFVTKRLAGDRVHVRAAGMHPTGDVNPAVAEVLAERGIEINRDFPTGTPYDIEDAADIVVDMGADLPKFPARRVIAWDIEDPAGRRVEAVRRICDDIERRVRELLEELEIPIDDSQAEPVATS